ncbi:MAG: LytTR family DNA-binding domain-containing protein [Bacteroidota bacterium]
MNKTKDFYLFNSRIATHIIFWVTYYVLFGLIWVKEEGYLASFYLEFVLMPIRILAVYFTIYFLLPKYLMKKRYWAFLLGYGLMLLAGGFLQRVFIHLFYENLLLNDSSRGLFSIMMLVRAIVLINTTVLFILAVKIFQLWVKESEKSQGFENEILEIRSSRRTHLVSTDDILFIEGLGNYVTYHLSDESKITSYGTIKATLEQLPKNFARVHKSYVVNKHHIKSYDAMTIDVNNNSIPRGKSVSDEVLAL